MSAAARWAPAALAVAALAVAAGAARAEDHQVAVRFAQFAPAQLDVLPGEPVTWANGSGRTHTVTADGGAFGSGALDSGAAFTARLDAVGAYPYHCTIHPGMVGEVDVRRVTLDPLPPAAVPAGARVAVGGRTADPGTAVAIQALRPGGGASVVATAAPSADGRWTATVAAARTADLQAVAGTDASETRRLLVSDRRVAVRATRSGLHVTVTPPLPYGRILVQRREREHFGWWPVRRLRLDYLSEARVRLAGRRPAQVRAILVGRDGWTPLATSPAITLRRR